jgi:uncharacterized cupin superfamily protein
VVPEAKLGETEHGRAPEDDGWFVLNAREARWFGVAGGGRYTSFEGDEGFADLGAGIHVLEPGEAMGKYHGEETQEGFLVLSGECLAIIEDEERRLRPWDYFHCVPWTEHILIGAGEGPCAIVCVGARRPGRGIRYTRPETAVRHGVAAAAETDSPREAYAGQERPAPTRFREGDLPA